MFKKIRADFPVLSKKINNHQLVYLDNASTTQKPQQIIDAISNFYADHNANTGRGVYTLGEQATTLYEQARANVAHFINARTAQEVVFTSGTTESINLVAATWAKQNIGVGDEILISELEHHANLLPWQRVARENNATLKFIPVNADGTLDLNVLSQLLTHRTKLVAVSHISNALGTHNDVATIIKAAHAVGAKVLVDAAQSAPHQIIDVQKLGCDFLAFSGHKMFGPTGIGVLYVAQAVHAAMPPYQLGGGMVYEAGYQTATWLPMPHRLEAGTPPIAQAIGLAAALDYLRALDFEQLRVHEAALTAQLIEGLARMPHITVLGPQEQLKEKGHLVSFKVDSMHPHDVASYLDQFGVCVRAGHHCAQPLANKLGIDASVRVSFYAYNTAKEVDLLLQLLRVL